LSPSATVKVLAWPSLSMKVILRLGDCSVCADVLWFRGMVLHTPRRAWGDPNGRGRELGARKSVADAAAMAGGSSLWRGQWTHGVCWGDGIFYRLPLSTYSLDGKALGGLQMRRVARGAGQSNKCVGTPLGRGEGDGGGETPGGGRERKKREKEGKRS